jgi:hypothetical protein
MALRRGRPKFVLGRLQNHHERCGSSMAFSESNHLSERIQLLQAFLLLGLTGGDVVIAGHLIGGGGIRGG